MNKAHRPAVRMIDRYDDRYVSVTFIVARCRCGVSASLAPSTNDVTCLFIDTTFTYPVVAAVSFKA